MDKVAYFKVKDDPGSSVNLYLNSTQMKDFIDEMHNATYDNGEEEKYIIETMLMTPEQFNNLPEFDGF